MADFARWTVAIEMALLLASLFALAALDDRTTRRVPRAWWWAAASVTTLIGLLTAAVILNALVAGPQTPGVKLLAGGGVLSLGMAAVAVVLAIRLPARTAAEAREAHVVANARPLADALGHLQHLEPCPNPDCQRIRRELRALAGDPAT